MYRHFPSDHPEFSQEKGKQLSGEAKHIMTTVRKVVLSLLDGKKSITIGEKGRGIKHKIELPDIKKPQHSSHTKKQMKEAIHHTLALSGVTTKKRITKALESLGGQYEEISPERFLHRLKNGKVERDYRFLMGMMQYMAQLG